MNKKLEKYNLQEIENRIFTLRGTQVMIDKDLSTLYGVETKMLNQAVKRNIERFPENFMFKLNKNEKNKLVTNCDRFEILKHSSTMPYAFTEQGVSMLSSVLRSNTAIKVSISIINAFVKMRRFISTNAVIFQRLDRVEQKQFEADQKFEQVFKAIEGKSLPPKQGIFFKGQIFDAYMFVADLIKSAKQSILLIDNYVDETVLTMLAKRNKNVSATIYTAKIASQLKLDLQKHNQQYSNIDMRIHKNSHDRFLIIPN
ncbi:MAG: ORF6N domain-containing protein [Bacteroidota bacterium]|nr:ORF6N domain-containing protein [Bacteroidota bacterium]